MHLEADMIDAVSNYEKTKLSMANVFLQYDQDTMIAKFSLKHDPSWLYLSFVKRIYRINRKSGNVQWSEDDWSSRYIRYRMYPSQNSGRAAFPHPALYETHYSTIIRKY